MQLPPIMHPHVPSDRQQVIERRQEEQFVSIGHDVGPIPELDPPELELDPEPDPDPDPELDPVPHAPALHVCPTAAQFWQA